MDPIWSNGLVESLITLLLFGANWIQLTATVRHWSLRMHLPIFARHLKLVFDLMLGSLRSAQKWPLRQKKQVWLKHPGPSELANFASSAERHYGKQDKRSANDLLSVFASANVFISCCISFVYIINIYYDVEKAYMHFKKPTICTSIHTPLAVSTMSSIELKFDSPMFLVPSGHNFDFSASGCWSPACEGMVSLRASDDFIAPFLVANR